MGIYLNSKASLTLYKSEAESPYFVDKSMFLKEIFPLIQLGNKHICITRPRRFGKTVMANMMAAFLTKGIDSRAIFDRLNISKEVQSAEHQNQYNVIYIDFSDIDDECSSYSQYINAIKTCLKNDLMQAYPQVKLQEISTVQSDLKEVFSQTGERFVFIFDEWDTVFHLSFITEADKKQYLQFLKSLLKDRAYVLLSYMTGILPIAKYSSGSELNMFMEYTMVTEEKFSEAFGFTESEVDMLYERYLKYMSNSVCNVTREGLRFWYDGYHTKAGERLYNPRSVVCALTNNNLGNYWTSSGPYDEIFYYLEKNVDDVRNDLALIVSGEAVPAKIREYAVSSTNLSTRDEIFSAMVVYGFLSCYNGTVYIPNKELMDKFDEMLQREPKLGYVYRLAKESEKMLRATLAEDTKTMSEILEFAHNTEVPLLSYNSEVELSAIVNLVYLAARDRYRVEREDKAGIGYVDFIFYPYNIHDDAIILELKVDCTPEEALQQIKDRQYMLRFTGKIAQKELCTGRILAVGISYNRKTKVHSCKTEILRERL